MKTLLMLLVAALVGAMAASVVVSQRAAERSLRELARAQAAWDTERAALEARVVGAAGAVPTERGHETAAPKPGFAVDRTDPAALLTRLTELRPSPGGSRHHLARRILHDLEALAECGPASVEPIENFLLQHVDVDYAALEPAAGFDATTAAGPASPGSGHHSPLRLEDDPLPTFGLPSPPVPPVDFAIPPTLRIGLLDVLRTIGGDPAERVLAATLANTVRGRELGYLVRILDDTAPGKYRELALASVRELLTTPPDEPVADRTEQDQTAPYYVLHRFHDPVFASTAEDLVVNERGEVNRWALGYLAQIRGEAVLPAVASAWRKGSLATPTDRLWLLSAVLPHIARRPEIDVLFREFIRDDRMPAAARIAVIHALSFGGTRTNPAPAAAPTGMVPVSASASARLAMVEGLGPDAVDASVDRAVRLAVENLRHAAQGDPVATPTRADFLRQVLSSSDSVSRPSP